jgi:GntR family transcriptional regulator
MGIALMNLVNTKLVDASAVSPLDRESPLPLYVQVKRTLQSRIMSWPADNDRFYTDQELCELFAVSRATVRQALAELEAEGLLRRRQGFGTFVNRTKIEETFAVSSDFADQWALSGRALSVAEVNVERRICPAPFDTMLELSPDTEVVCIERLRLAGGLRIATDRRYIPLAFAKGIPRREFNKVSLLEVLGRTLQLERGDAQIEAALAGEVHAERLHILPADPVLVRHLVYWSTEGVPVMAGVSIYRADQVRYKLSTPIALSGAATASEIHLRAVAA